MLLQTLALRIIFGTSRDKAHIIFGTSRDKTHIIFGTSRDKSHKGDGLRPPQHESHLQVYL